MGLAGEMPDYMLNEGRHAPLYFSEQRLYLRKPDGECFYVNPRYAHAHAMHMHMPCTSHALTHHPAASLPRVLPRSPAAPQPRSPVSTPRAPHRPCALRDVLGTEDELFLDFMSRMLTLDMHARLSASAALAHPWFTTAALPRPALYKPDAPDADAPNEPLVAREAARAGARVAARHPVLFQANAESKQMEAPLPSPEAPQPQPLPLPLPLPLPSPQAPLPLPLPSPQAPLQVPLPSPQALQPLLLPCAPSPQAPLPSPTSATVPLPSPTSTAEMPSPMILLVADATPTAPQAPAFLAAPSAHPQPAPLSVLLTQPAPLAPVVFGDRLVSPPPAAQQLLAGSHTQQSAPPPPGSLLAKGSGLATTLPPPLLGARSCSASGASRLPPRVEILGEVPDRAPVTNMKASPVETRPQGASLAGRGSQDGALGLGLGAGGSSENLGSGEHAAYLGESLLEGNLEWAPGWQRSSESALSEAGSFSRHRQGR